MPSLAQSAVQGIVLSSRHLINFLQVFHIEVAFDMDCVSIIISAFDFNPDIESFLASFCA